MIIAIDWSQFGKPQDNDGLVGEHFISDCETLDPLLAHIFNGAMCKVSQIVGQNIPL
mgnify:CR=1 FL=1